MSDLRALRAGESVTFIGPRFSAALLLALAALSGVMAAIILGTAIRVSLSEELALPEMHRLGTLSLWETVLIGALEAVAALAVGALALTALLRDRRLRLDREGVTIDQRTAGGRRTLASTRWSEVTDIAAMSSGSRGSAIPVAQTIRFATADDERPAYPRIRFLARKPKHVLALAQAVRATFAPEQRRERAAGGESSAR